MSEVVRTGDSSPEIVRSIGAELDELRDITFLFTTGCGHLQRSGEVDAVLRMMLLFRDDEGTWARSLLRPGFDAHPSGANSDETEQQVRGLVAKLKQYEDVTFAIAWFIEGQVLMDIDHSDNIDVDDAYNDLVAQFHPEVRRQLGVA